MIWEQEVLWLYLDFELPREAKFLKHAHFLFPLLKVHFGYFDTLISPFLLCFAPFSIDVSRQNFMIGNLPFLNCQLEEGLQVEPALGFVQ